MSDCSMAAWRLSKGSIRTFIPNRGSLESEPTGTAKSEMSATPPAPIVPGVVGRAGAVARRSAASATDAETTRIAAFQR